ncbi:MAG TPA: plastocyanin/azurin family copper-binding protein [Anaeromyxobacteraceae bacterium]|nr:plastocyanin/azurin family copper-binding protein [Anaeromyxobacteraceae bacterium]
MRARRGILATLLFAWGCGSSGGSGGGNVIQFGGGLGLAYSPGVLAVHVGDTVTWEGDFSTHPLVSGANCGQPDGLFQNSTGSRFSFTFQQAGTYPYYCNVHCGVGMRGQIHVQ